MLDQNNKLKSIININTFLVLIVTLMFNISFINAQEIPEDFDHDLTNFLLSGSHLNVECKVCHVRDVYQGIPTNCEDCHSSSSLIAKTKKTIGHFESVDSCDNCHTVETWVGARIDHDSVVGTCIDCHNNIVTSGKEPDHVQSVDDCEQCHTTRRWKQSGFDHDVITGNCFSCHNGSTAKGKSEKHRLSNNQCDDCHQVKNWKSKTYDHKKTDTACLNCHQDILPVKPHPQNNKCQKCHSPNKKWQQSRYKHEKTSKFCVSCHKNRKPTNHFIIDNETSLRCDDCHRSTASWLSNLRFEHEVTDFHEHRVNTPCTSCHLSNSKNVLWRFAALKTKCAACHGGSFNPTSHTKSPSVNYTVSELAHCSVSCHSYTDNTFTVRDNSRNKNSNYHTTTRGKGISAP
ncbi:hypothetical protein MNBD_GAMMA22-1032 [hydrothermal vent metagenome]|uniref:Uncharacterized protein n=1 Tax=hydrothermal vent metagenome TaxID=652676 RepID=A0A3B1A9Y5_9ZZZZ